MQQDDSTLRNGKRFRSTEVSRSPSPDASHANQPSSAAPHQHSSDVFQTYTHRPSPNSFSHDENSAEHSRIASPLLAAADKSYLDLFPYVDDIPATTSQVPITLASASRVISHSEPNSPTRDRRFASCASFPHVRTRHSSAHSQDNYTTAAPSNFVTPDLQAASQARTGHSELSNWDFNSEEDDDPEVQFKRSYTRDS